MSSELAKDLLSYIHQQATPFPIEVRKQETPKKGPVELLTPIICLDVHPFLQKVCDALTQHVATTSLLSLQKIEQMGWDALFSNPFFQILLVPMDVMESIPLLKQKLPSAVPHQLTASIFPLEPIEVYLQDTTKKRDLWENLKRMPLSS